MIRYLAALYCHSLVSAAQVDSRDALYHIFDVRIYDGQKILVVSVEMLYGGNPCDCLLA